MVFGDLIDKMEQYLDESQKIAYERRHTKENFYNTMGKIL